MMRAEVRQRLNDGARAAREAQGLSRDVDHDGEPRRKASIVVHVDMDAFFAAIEERDNPNLRGKPVVVGGPKGSRGVITTANYVARQYGVHAGMSLAKADQLCPDAIHVSTKGGKYTYVSLQLMEVLRRFSPEVEPYSVDEAFLDATGCVHLFGGNLQRYGMAIKTAIRRHLGLTGSVGIGPSRVVAKMASGLQKPDGLTIIEPHQVARRLGPLQVRKIPGVGPSTETVLKAMNIETVQDLIDAPRSLLQMRMGKYGNDLGQKMAGAAGLDEVGFDRPTEDKSKGHEHTFAEDITSRVRLRSQLLAQAERVCRRMRHDRYVGRRVTLKLRTQDFRTRSHQRVMKDWTDDPVEIYTLACTLLDEIWREAERVPVRLIGISVSGLIRPGEPMGIQEDVFELARRTRRSSLLGAVDDLQDRYGEHVLGLAAAFPSRRKHGVRASLSQ